eukprot:93070-Pelagomonas_calceolata.AAC.1
MESWRGFEDCLQSLVFKGHRLAHGLVGLGAAVASLQPPIEDALAHGSFRVLHKNFAFPFSGSVTGGHMQGSPSAHQAWLTPDPAASII